MWPSRGRDSQGQARLCTKAGFDGCVTPRSMLLIFDRVYLNPLHDGKIQFGNCALHSLSLQSCTLLLVDKGFGRTTTS